MIPRSSEQLGNYPGAASYDADRINASRLTLGIKSDECLPLDLYTSVSFTDVMITDTNGKFSSDLYVKPTNKHQ